MNKTDDIPDEVIEEYKLREKAYLNTKSSWQSKELTKTGPRTPDLVRQIRFVCPSSIHHFGENVRLRIFPIL